MKMSETKSFTTRTASKELHELTKTDNTVLLLIYSISELIVSSYLDQDIEPDIKEIVKGALFVELKESISYTMASY